MNVKEQAAEVAAQSDRQIVANTRPKPRYWGGEMHRRCRLCIICGAVVLGTMEDLEDHAVIRHNVQSRYDAIRMANAQ